MKKKRAYRRFQLFKKIRKQLRIWLRRRSRYLDDIAYPIYIRDKGRCVIGRVGATEEFNKLAMRYHIKAV